MTAGQFSPTYIVVFLAFECLWLQFQRAGLDVQCKIFPRAPEIEYRLCLDLGRTETCEVRPLPRPESVGAVHKI